MTLATIPERTFEAAGLCIGFVGPLLIALQLRAEWLSRAPSTLSPLYVAGFLLVYFFWFLYGLRFRRFAVWFWNLVGCALQTALLLAVLWK